MMSWVVQWIVHTIAHIIKRSYFIGIPCFTKAQISKWLLLLLFFFLYKSMAKLCLDSVCHFNRFAPHTFAFSCAALLVFFFSFACLLATLFIERAYIFYNITESVSHGKFIMALQTRFNTVKLTMNGWGLWCLKTPYELNLTLVPENCNKIYDFIRKNNNNNSESGILSIWIAKVWAWTRLVGVRECEKLLSTLFHRSWRRKSVHVTETEGTNNFNKSNSILVFSHIENA